MISYFCLTQSIFDSITGALLISIRKKMELLMLYDTRSAHILPLRTHEDGFTPKWHFCASKSYENGDFTSFHFSREAKEVVFARISAVYKALRRLKILYFN